MTKIEKRDAWIGVAIFSTSISAALCIGVAVMILFPQFFS